MKKLVLPMLAVMLALVMVPVNAEVTTNEKIPIDGYVCSDCTGECVYVVGEEHYVAAATEDGAGGYHVKYHINLKADGESDSGIKYTLNEAVNQEVNAGPGEVFTYVANANLIAQGAADNLAIKITYHVTVNANGEVTSEIENMEQECRG